MKKIYLVSALMVLLGLLFSMASHWFRFFYGFELLLFPAITGILLVLVQKENISNKFLLKFIIGALLTCFVFSFILFSIECFSLSPFLHCSIFNIFGVISFSLMLTSISILGGFAGIIVKKVIVFYGENSRSKSIVLSKKIIGGIFLSISLFGFFSSVAIFLILFFNSSSSLLDRVVVDFRLIELVGVTGYYLSLISSLIAVLILMLYTAAIGLILFSRKRIFNLKLFLGLSLTFLLFFTILVLLFFHIESRIEERRAKMKSQQSIKHYSIKDFNIIDISRFVEFDEIVIKQGEEFSIIAEGSEYDQIGLNFEKIDNTLLIKRSELETYYNTDTWNVENRENILFPAGTKHLVIEIIMPDIEKISISGGNVELKDLKVDNIEIALNKRFNNIKGNISVENTLKLDAYGGVINLDGTAKNLTINSGDCWIEMDELIAENAIINAKNTSRLNVNVSSDIEIKSNDNSGITNHYNK